PSLEVERGKNSYQALLRAFERWAPARSTGTCARAPSDGGLLGPKTTDEQLMLAFRGGDVRAFEALVARHRGPVYNFILRPLGHTARAEEVLQETWLRGVRGARDWEPRARFTTWVYTSARSLCVDTARKESYRQAESLDAPVGGADGEGRALGEQIPDAGQ